jgi:hypothetical protein
MSLFPSERLRIELTAAVLVKTCEKQKKTGRALSSAKGCKQAQFQLRLVNAEICPYLKGFVQLKS